MEEGGDLREREKTRKAPSAKIKGRERKKKIVNGKTIPVDGHRVVGCRRKFGNLPEITRIRRRREGEVYTGGEDATQRI